MVVVGERTFRPLYPQERDRVANVDTSYLLLYSFKVLFLAGVCVCVFVFECVCDCYFSDINSGYVLTSVAIPLMFHNIVKRNQTFKRTFI